MPEADLRVGSVEDAHRVDNFLSGLLHRLIALPITPAVRMHEPSNGSVEVEKIYLPTSVIQLLDLRQFVLRGPFPAASSMGAKSRQQPNSMI